MLLHNETDGKVTEPPQKVFNIAVEEEELLKSNELAATQPLLTPQPFQAFSSMAEHANLLATPVEPTLQNVGDLSPFVLLDEPQLEIDVETEADISLEEAEEARESPLHKRLSMSLITYHEGATSAQIFAEVHHGSTSPEPSTGVETLKDGVDHSYALPSITVEPESPVEPCAATELDQSPLQASSAEPMEAEKRPPSEETKTQCKEIPLAVASAPSETQIIPSPEQPQLCTGIRCPTFDVKSPSQVVFKPQWLGKGFGATGLRARGVQGYSGNRSSSPLAIRVAVKNVTNENKGQPGKLKQKGV